MGAALFPAVKRQFKRAQKIFSRQNRPLLVPDDGLAEVEAAFFEGRRVVAEISIATPEEETPAGLEDPCQVPKPGPEQALELFLRDESIDQRPVLGAQLLVRGLGLRGMTPSIPTAVRREGTQPRRHGVVGAWLDLHVVRRVRMHELDPRSGHEAVYVSGLAGIAA